MTNFDDPLESIRTNKTARTPILIGSVQDDGSLFAVGLTNLTEFLASELSPSISLDTISPDTIRALYPGQNDSQVISSSIRDFVFRWCVSPHRDIEPDLTVTL